MNVKGSMRESVGTFYLRDDNRDNNRNNNRNDNNNNINYIESIISSSNSSISNNININLNNDYIFNDDNDSDSFSENSVQNNNLLIDSICLINTSRLNPDKKECTICLEKFNINDKIINLECLHMFHNNCIKNWLKMKDYCPICKNKIK